MKLDTMLLIFALAFSSLVVGLAWAALQCMRREILRAHFASETLKERTLRVTAEVERDLFKSISDTLLERLIRLDPKQAEQDPLVRYLQIGAADPQAPLHPRPTSGLS